MAYHQIIVSGGETHLNASALFLCFGISAPLVWKNPVNRALDILRIDVGNKA